MFPITATHRCATMKRKTTNSPYPILYPQGEEYLSEQGYNDASFDAAGDPEVTVDPVTHNLWIRLDFELAEGTLKNLVENGDARYYVNIECGRTYYRKPVLQTETHFELEIPYTEVSGSIEIFVGIVAARDVKGFHAVGFSDRFGNAKFDIEKGDILAVGTGWNVELEELDGDVTPYIYVAEDKSEEDRSTLWVDGSNDVLTVYLAKELYEIYYNRANSDKFKNLIMALVMKPAILSALQKEIVRARSTGDDEPIIDTQGRRWLRKLDGLLQYIIERDGYSWDINSVKIDEDQGTNTLCFAVEHIMANPLRKSMKDINDKL